MSVDVESRLREALRARAERTPVGAGERDVTRVVVVERGRRLPLVLATASLALVLGLGAALLLGTSSDDRRIRSSPGDLAADPVGSEPGPISDDETVDLEDVARELLLPPGLTLSMSSSATPSSSIFGELVRDVADGHGWEVTTRETATRLTAEAGEVQYVYLAEPDRRLFVLVGNAELIAGIPQLVRHLDADEVDGRTVWRWPDTIPLAETVAVGDGERTVVVRSEGIESSDRPRSTAEMIDLADDVLTAETGRVPVAWTSEWTDRREALIADKAELSDGAGGEVVNAGEWAYLSEPIDITGPGSYRLVFRDVHFTDANVGGGFLVPPDTQFTHELGAFELVENNGTNDLVVDIDVTVDEFRQPYERWTIWFV